MHRAVAGTPACSSRSPHSLCTHMSLLNTLFRAGVLRAGVLGVGALVCRRPSRSPRPPFPTIPKRDPRSRDSPSGGLGRIEAPVFDGFGRAGARPRPRRPLEGRLRPGRPGLHARSSGSARRRTRRTASSSRRSPSAARRSRSSRRRSAGAARPSRSTGEPSPRRITSSSSRSSRRSCSTTSRRGTRSWSPSTSARPGAPRCGATSCGSSPTSTAP